MVSGDLDKLIEREAFEAMVLSLEKFYESTQSDDIGALIGSMMILEDGGAADPAVWGEWTECVRNALSKRGS